MPNFFRVSKVFTNKRKNVKKPLVGVSLHHFLRHVAAAAGSDDFFWRRRRRRTVRNRLDKLGNHAVRVAAVATQERIREDS